MVIRRIKDRWHNSTPDTIDRDVVAEKTLHDQAGALGFIIWRHGLNGAINLHAEDYRYDSDQQRVGVITELLAFQVQHTDRLSHEFLQHEARATFIQALVAKLADHIQDNLSDIAGEGNYRPPFIKLLNERFSDYAEFKYDAAQPGYDCLRYLGHEVLAVMGDDQTNRWVIDQIIGIDAPELVDKLTVSVHRLFGIDSK